MHGLNDNACANTCRRYSRNPHINSKYYNLMFKMNGGRKL